MKYSEIDKNKKYLDDRLYFVNHKGKTIMVSDYQGLFGEEYERVIDEHRDFLGNIDFEGKKILNLCNFEGTKAGGQVIEKLKQNAEIFSKEHVEKTASIGLTALQKVFISAFLALGLVNLKPFGTKEEALDWLAE